MCCLEVQLQRIADQESGKRQEVLVWKSCTAEVVSSRKHTNAFIYCKLGKFALLQQQIQCGQEAKSAKSEVKAKGDIPTNYSHGGESGDKSVFDFPAVCSSC